MFRGAFALCVPLSQPAKRWRILDEGPPDRSRLPGARRRRRIQFSSYATSRPRSWNRLALRGNARASGCRGDAA